MVNLGLVGVFGIALARFVSVEDFGVYNYAVSAASFGSAIMVGGLMGLAIREYHAHPRRAAAITGGILIVREVLALAVYVMVVLVSVSAGDAAVVAATAVAGLAVLARVFDAPELWFQSRLEAKTPALIRIAVGVAFFGARIIVLWVYPSVVLLIVLFVLEQTIMASAILASYVSRNPRGARLDFDVKETLRLARMSLPLFFSSLANQVSLRGDIFILQAFSGAFAVGIYSAAVRVTEMLYALPLAFMTATFPRLLSAKVEARDDVRNSYREQVQRALDASFWLGVLAIIATYGLGEWVLVGLFGEAYRDSAATLRMLVLAAPFVFMAAVVSKWIIAENRLWLSLGRHATGAILVVLLSVILIPRMGQMGAAIATVAAYFCSSYLFAFASRYSRRLAFQMTLAIFAPARVIVGALRGRKNG